MRHRKFTKVQIKDALNKTGGRVTSACLYLEKAYGITISRTSLYKWIDKHPDVKEIRDKAQDRIVDIAEYNIWQAVRNGDLKQSRFILMNLGRKHGYGIHRVEHADADGKPLWAQRELSEAEINDMSDEQLDDFLHAVAAED